MNKKNQTNPKSDTKKRRKIEELKKKKKDNSKGLLPKTQQKPRAQVPSTGLPFRPQASAAVLAGLKRR